MWLLEPLVGKNGPGNVVVAAWVLYLNCVGENTLSFSLTELSPEPHLYWNRHGEQDEKFMILTGLAVFELKLLRIKKIRIDWDKNVNEYQDSFINWKPSNGSYYENVMLKFSVVYHVMVCLRYIILPPFKNIELLLSKLFLLGSWFSSCHIGKIQEGKWQRI